MKNKIVSTIKTSAGELELSEDALCKHTIFIGSTGSGKTTSQTCFCAISSDITWKTKRKKSDYSSSI